MNEPTKVYYLRLDKPERMVHCTLTERPPGASPKNWHLRFLSGGELAPRIAFICDILAGHVILLLSFIRFKRSGLRV